MRVAGVDGYKGGWIAVVIDADDIAGAALVWAASLQQVLDLTAAEIAVIDIPLGLSSGPFDRPVESAIRAVLPGKASSVFNTPCRQSLHAASYPDACAENFVVLKKKLSKQTWAIMPKIKEADAVVSRSDGKRILEGHPEVSFAIHQSSPLISSKHRAKGLLARVGILAEIGFDFQKLTSDLPDNHPAKPDDIADAAILAWTAIRVSKGEAIAFPSDPQTDTNGILMAVVA